MWKITQLCPSLWDPMDCSPPGFSVHGILQARILKWIAMSSSRGSSQPRDWTQVSFILSIMSQIIGAFSTWLGASLVAQTVKNLPAMQKTQVWSLGQEDPLEKEMAPHSSILAWRIPWTEKPGGLQSMGLQRVGQTERLTLSLSWLL